MHRLRNRMRRWTWQAAGLLLGGVCQVTCEADPPTRTASAGQAPVQQPAGSSATAAANDELNTVLTRWVETAAGIETLEGRFVRQEFDATHQTETRGYGRIRYESEGRAMYVLEPYPLQPKMRSSRATPRGVAYQLTTSKTETLYWVSGQVARIYPKERTFELFEVPEAFWTPGAVETTDSFDVVWTTLGCLERYVPGLVETDLADLRQRFEWTLVSIDQDRIALSAKPLTPADQRHCSTFLVYIDTKTWFTHATKVIDSTGMRETVHTFADLKANLVPASNAPDWAPDIGRMRLLTAPPLAPPADDN